MTSSIRDLAQKYNVTVHRKVEKFIQNEIREPPRKEEARLFINDLPNYPFLQERWDVDKIEGRESMYRVRIGRYRIYYLVDSVTREIKVIEAKLK